MLERKAGGQGAASFVNVLTAELRTLFILRRKEDLFKLDFSGVTALRSGREPSRADASHLQSMMMLVRSLFKHSGAPSLQAPCALAARPKEAIMAIR